MNSHANIVMFLSVVKRYSVHFNICICSTSDSVNFVHNTYTWKCGHKTTGCAKNRLLLFVIKQMPLWLTHIIAKCRLIVIILSRETWQFKDAVTP